MPPLTATATYTTPISSPIPDTTAPPSAPLAPPPLPPLPLSGPPLPLPLSGPPLPAGEGAGGEVSDALDDTVDALGYTPRDRRSQIWQRFCDGLSLSAIARDLGLDRQTVSRHVHAIQAELAADDRAFARLALLQAVHSQLALQTAALSAYRAEVAIEDDYRNAYGFAQESAVATAKAMGAVHPDIPHATGQAHSVQQGIEHGAHAICTQAPYRAQRARLLSVASTAAWRAALLLDLVPRSGSPTPSGSNATAPVSASAATPAPTTPAAIPAAIISPASAPDHPPTSTVADAPAPSSAPDGPPTPPITPRAAVSITTTATTAPSAASSDPPRTGGRGQPKPSRPNSRSDPPAHGGQGSTTPQYPVANGGMLASSSRPPMPERTTPKPHTSFGPPRAGQPTNPPAITRSLAGLPAEFIPRARRPPPPARAPAVLSPRHTPPTTTAFWTPAHGGTA